MTQKERIIDHGLKIYITLGVVVMSLYMMVALYGKYHYLLPWHVQ